MLPALSCKSVRTSDIFPFSVVGAPLGDALSLMGAILYAVSNVAQEFLVKKHSILEFLALLGLFASVIAGVQM